MKVKLFKTPLNLLTIFSINFLMSITGVFFEIFDVFAEVNASDCYVVYKINQNMDHIIYLKLLQKLISLISHVQQSVDLILLKMSIKKLVKQLEKHIHVKFPEYEAKFYSNCRNMYIHMGLDESLFYFENYKQVL